MTNWRWSQVDVELQLQLQERYISTTQKENYWDRVIPTVNHSVYVLNLHIQVNYVNRHPSKATVSRKPFLCCRIILYHQYAGQACTVQIVCLHQGFSILLKVLPVESSWRAFIWKTMFSSCFFFPFLFWKPLSLHILGFGKSSSQWISLISTTYQRKCQSGTNELMSLCTYK